MESFCNADCSECELFKNSKCQGCKNTKGCPFGKKCWIAKYVELGGKNSFNELKKALIQEFNALKIDGMPKIAELYPLNGAFVNLEYPLPNGKKVKFLHDDEAYLGTQVACTFNDGSIKRCFGLLANMDFLLVSEYGEDGLDPEIIMYKKR